MNPSPLDPGVMPEWAYTTVLIIGCGAAVVLALILTVMVRDWMRGRRR